MEVSSVESHSWSHNHNPYDLGSARQHCPPSICRHNLKQLMSGSPLPSCPRIEAARKRRHRTQILLHTRNARDPTPFTTPATLPPLSIFKPHLAQTLAAPTSSLHPYQALTPSTSPHLFPHLPTEPQIIIRKHAFNSAIATHCSVYQVQHISDESASSHKLSIRCGNSWPQKQSLFGLQTAS